MSQKSDQDASASLIKTAKAEHAQIRETTENIEDSADRRTQLAADRTVFAAERTYAAWMRTGLAALASGVGAKALLKSVSYSFIVVGAGSVLTLFSAFCFIAAIWRQLFVAAPPRPDVRRIPSWILFVVNGFLALVALAALISIFTPTPP